MSLRNSVHHRGLLAIQLHC